MSEQIGELFGDPIVTVTQVIGPVSRVECPFCDQTHEHGNGKNAKRDADYKELMTTTVTVPQHRSVGCLDGGYWLVYTEDTRGLAWGDSGWETTGDMRKKERMTEEYGL